VADAPGSGRRDLTAVLLKTAWMSILLGFLMQVLTLAAVKLAGGKDPTLALIVRDLVQKVAWSTLVCIGLATGTAASQSRQMWMGFLGFLAAPAAFVIARTLHKAATEALKAAAPDQMPTGVLVTVLVLKAIEYGTLGAGIAWLSRRPWGGLLAHVMAGLAAGVAFGVAIVLVVYLNAKPPMPAPKLVAQTINEVVFPMGCALVLFAANTLGKSIRTT